MFSAYMTYVCLGISFVYGFEKRTATYALILHLLIVEKDLIGSYLCKNFSARTNFSESTKVFLKRA